MTGLGDGSESLAWQGHGSFTPTPYLKGLARALYRGSLLPRFKFLQLVRQSIAPGLEVIAFNDHMGLLPTDSQQFSVEPFNAFLLRFDVRCGLDAQGEARASPML